MKSFDINFETSSKLPKIKTGCFNTSQREPTILRGSHDIRKYQRIVLCVEF